MPDAEIWRKLEALQHDAQDARERLVRIETGASHRDEKLDKAAEAISALAINVSQIQTLLNDVKSKAALARWLAGTGKGAALVVAGFIFGNWQAIKRWLP